MNLLKAYEKVPLVEHQKWLTLDASSEGRLSLAWCAPPLPPTLDYQFLAVHQGDFLASVCRPAGTNHWRSRAENAMCRITFHPGLFVQYMAKLQGSSSFERFIYCVYCE